MVMSLRIFCSLYLVFALTAGLFYHLHHSRPALANTDEPPTLPRPLGIIAGLLAAGALICFLVLAA